MTIRRLMLAASLGGMVALPALAQAPADSALPPPPALSTPKSDTVLPDAGLRKAAPEKTVPHHKMRHVARAKAKTAATPAKVR